MEFSSPLFVDQYRIVVPVRVTRDVWSFLDPLSVPVWIVFLLCIPTISLAMVLADYFYFSSFRNWETSVGFVVRVACLDHSSHLGGDRKYSKLFVMVWTWAALVIATSYAGTLTALITRVAIQ